MMRRALAWFIVGCATAIACRSQTASVITVDHGSNAPEQQAKVLTEIGQLLAGTGLEGAEIVPVSTVTGEGVAALREKLFDAARAMTARAAAELSEARRLSGDDHYATIAHLRAEYLGEPKIRALYEAVYFAGLRIAGMPEK